MGLSPLDQFGKRSTLDLLSNPVQQFGQDLATQYGVRSQPIYNDYLSPVESVATMDSGNNYTDPNTMDWGNSYTGGGYGADAGNKYTDMFSQMASGYGQQQGALSSAGGQVGTVGGNWAALDAHNDAISRAAQQYGAPANLIKAMVNRESSGNWNRDNRIAIIRDENGNITRWKADGTPDRMLPFVGIFESTAAAWGLDWNAMVGNKDAQIAGMAKILNGLSQKYGGYENAAYVYFGGEDALNKKGRGGFKDEFGMDSDTYGGKAISDWKWLDQQSGYTGGYGNSSGMNIGIESFVPGGAIYDWGEFGADSDAGYYGYGLQYGLNGRQHTGADITAPRGSTYVAPMGGTVMCSGTGQGKSADGSSCAAFQDVGGGAGRVEVLLDNGAVMIFGHSATSALQPGQRFNAGDALGTVGTMNSDHVHLEARVRDMNTPSGWRIVDPRSIFGAGGMPGPGLSLPPIPSFRDIFQKYLRRS